MVVFLQQYKQNHSNSDAEFLNAFAYSIYDFLEDKKAQSYNLKFKNRLEAVARETFHVSKQENSHLTKKLLEECLKGKHRKFSKELSNYLITFLPIRADEV